jgi:anti-sigma B factor antagonist
MPDSLKITRTLTADRLAVLRVEGRLDSKNANQLRKAGAEVAAEGRNLVINLRGVTFMGSSGLGALLALSEEFHEQAGEIRVAEPSEAACLVFRLVSLDQILLIDNTEPESVAALKAA